MSVIRVNKTKDYSVMSNYHLKDKKISLKAKGLLSVMLSLPDDWNYTVEGLVAICKENVTAINSCLKELKENNYLVVEKHMPNQTESGRIEYTYEIYENPKQAVKKQDLENLGVEILGVENPTQLNTNILNTKKQNTNISNNISKRFSKPTLEEVSNYIKEFDYHFSAEDFINHYESVGWKVGKSAMKDWKACCRTWESNWKKKNQPEVKPGTIIFKSRKI